jgi:ribosomal protein S20
MIIISSCDSMKEPNERNKLEAKEYKYEVKTTEKVIAEELASKDPVFMANLIYSLKEDRDRTNGLLATLLRKIESLEKKIENIENKTLPHKEERILGDVDSELIEFVKKNRKVNAKDVQKQFKYKGRNAASSRLHKLYTEGLLDKKQAGRNVYYLMK